MAWAALRRASSSHRVLAALLREQGVRNITVELGSRCSSTGELGFGREFSSETAVQMKALLERTGAPFRDVKIAVQQCGWDAEAAVLELRKKGLAAASKKAVRVGSDGLLAVASGEGVTAVVEINSETDFVARNEIFRHLATRIARAALGVQAWTSAPGSASTIDLPALEAVKIKLEHEKLSGEATVQEAVSEVAAIMGENVRLRRGFLVSSTTSIVSSYLLASAQPGLAIVVGLVTLEPEYGILVGQDAEAQIGAALAMHVVAAKPLFLSRELVPQVFLHRETDVFRSQISLFPSLQIQGLFGGTNVRQNTQCGREDGAGPSSQIF